MLFVSVKLSKSDASLFISCLILIFLTCINQSRILERKSIIREKEVDMCVSMFVLLSVKLAISILALLAGGFKGSHFQIFLFELNI